MEGHDSRTRREEAEILARHGGDLYALGRRSQRDLAELLDFSGCANAYAQDVSDRLFRETPYDYSRYPDNRCDILREAVAAHEGVGAESILAGNGISDIIWLAMDALRPRNVLFIGPVYAEYARCCLLRGIPYEIVSPNPEDDFVFSPASLRAVWETTADLAVICTPNHVGGGAYPTAQELFGVLRTPRVLVDGTFREFLWGDPAYAAAGWKGCASQAQAGVSVFFLSAFANFFACPGLPLAYLAGDGAALRRMGQVKPLWTVSAHAQAMGVRLLEHIEAYRETLPSLRRQGEAVAMRLRRMACFDPDRVSTGASYVTAGLAGSAGTASVTEKLLRQGCVVRNCDAIPGMPPGYIRLQIRPDKDMERILPILEWHAERGW